MPIAQWTYYVHHQSDGEPIGELDLKDVSVTDTLSGTSEITGSLGIDDRMARRDMTGTWLREVTAVRTNELGQQIVAMHGPITARKRSRKDARRMTLTVQSPQAYFHKRVTEHPRNYHREQFSIVRSLLTDAMAKTGGALYRINLGSNSSGVIKRLVVGGTDRQVVAELMEGLASDPDTGFDFRWDYTIDPVQHTVSRILTLGYPSIGRDLSASRVLSDSIDLEELDDEEDGSVAANRVHVLGAGTGTKRLRAVGNSGTSLVQGYPLLEHVIDHSDVKQQAQLNALATHAVRALMPVPLTLTTTHHINDEFPFGAVDLGDTVRVQTAAGGDPLDLRRRVTQITTKPETDRVTFGYYAPQDEVL